MPCSAREALLVALVSRRTVLAGAAAIAGAPLLGALDAERLAWAQRHPPRIDHAVVESLADVLAAQRRAEDSVGPRAVMKPVLAQLAEIEDLVRQARGPLRPALADEPRYRERAVAAPEAGYAGLPDDQRSSAWTAPTLARLAAVHVRAGDVEEASAVALQCADIARLTGSP
jgi:hypothetical protein